MAINPIFGTSSELVSHLFFDPLNSNAEVVAVYDERGSVTYFDVVGNPYVPANPLVLTTSVPFDREIKSLCYKAVSDSATSEYVMDEKVECVIVYDTTQNPAVEVSRFYTNINTGVTVSSFLITDFDPCESGAVGIETNVEWYEDSANVGTYFMGIWVFSEDSLTPTLTFYDVNGNVAVTPPVSPVPVFSPDFETVKTCMQAVNAGTGYVIGDKITRIDFYNAATQSLLGTVYQNTVGGAVITPNLADLGPCTDGSGIEKEVLTLIDYDSATRERVYFLRHINVDNSTGNTTVLDTTLDGITLYTVSGTVFPEHQRFTVGSGESVAITDVTIVNLTPPVWADMAEIHVWDADIVWDKRVGVANVTSDGSVGYGRHTDGAYFELEGKDELANFQAVAFGGQSGRLEVHYAEGLHVNK